MRRALALARRGAGRVSPNPMVGAVVVRNGCIVGEGYHRCFGGPHAEVHALRRAGAAARDADLYVTLEPCSHHGKTPPCVDAVIASGIRRVFVGMLDPNPAVCRRGVSRLRAAGITVEVGLCGAECRELNEWFAKFITTGRPYVMLKAAMTLDGNIATRTGHSQWITCEQSRRLVHRLRAQSDAVLVGSETVLRDDPRLNVRLVKKGARDPLRIVADSRLRIRRTCALLREDPQRTIVATAPARAASVKARSLERAGASVVAVPQRGGHIDFERLMEMLGRRGIASVLIEGGAEVNAAALFSGVVDRVLFFYAPLIVGGRRARTGVAGTGAATLDRAVRLTDVRVTRVGVDLLVEGRPEVSPDRPGE